MARIKERRRRNVTRFVKDAEHVSQGDVVAAITAMTYVRVGTKCT